MQVTNIADLRREAKRILPKTVFTYVENGGYEEETLRRNLSDLQRIALLPRVLNDVSQRTLETKLAGMPSSLPLALAPVGACGLTYPNGEVEAARAAKEIGIPFCLSTLSISTIEDVHEGTHSPFWFQLYLMRDRQVGNALVERARDAGCSTLVLSMDLHVRSQRHPESKRGLGAPPKIGLQNAFDALTHLRWLLRMARSKRRTFGNLIGLVPDAKDIGKITCWLESQFDPTLSVKDIEWARQTWSQKLFVKGILHPDDARAAVDHGADGIIVSNHGGRQIDSAVSTISMLPAIVEAVGGRGEVLVDSGIRSGMDVLKMLASGATGCLIGRAYLYGLAWRGRIGVRRALELIRDELDQTMALCGVRDIRSLPRDLIVRTEQP